MADNPRVITEQVVVAEADVEEVLTILRNELSEEEFHACKVTKLGSTAPRRGPIAEAGIAVVQFVIISGASGLTWDLTKKALAILEKKLGAARVAATTSSEIGESRPGKVD